MSTIKSSDEHLTLNADGSSKDIKFQANGVEKASISSSGAFTSTTIDATKLTGDLPAISGAALTGVSSVGGATGVDFNDNVKARFGTGNDLEIYHDGSSSYISDTGATGLIIKNDALQLARGGNTEKYLEATANGSVDLYHNNNKKIETTANGVAVTGKVELDSSGTVLELGTWHETSGKGHYFTSNSNSYYQRWSAASTSTSYFVEFYNPNAFVGAISTNGSSTSYATSSDHRLKENVDYTWDATTRLKQLKPARFNFIADDTNTPVDGFLAHEVSSIVPEAVTGTKDATETYTDDEGNEQTRIVAQGIDQSKLVPLLVKTIQELEARITALEA